MFGLSESTIILLALGLAGVLLLAGAFSSLPSVARTVTRSFWCPFRRGNVTAEFREEVWDGEPLEVTRCTAFTPPTVIRRKRLCLHVERFPSLRGSTSRA